MNCRNCGADSWSEGRCDFCWSSRYPPAEELTHFSDALVITTAYFNGFIDETQRLELLEQIGFDLLVKGEAFILPAGLDARRVTIPRVIADGLRPIEFVSSQSPLKPIGS